MSDKLKTLTLAIDQIERQYGKSGSSKFNNQREVISYKFHLLNLLLMNTLPMKANYHYQYFY